MPASVNGRHALSTEDDHLIAACLNGDEHAWRTLLERYNRLIYTIPLRFGFSHGVAEEIFQEVCIIVLEKLVTLQEPARFRSWLITIVRRVCLQRLRDQNNDVAIDDFVEEELTAPAPERFVLETEQRAALLTALNQLDERCQTLLRALFFEQPALSYEAIAHLLMTPLGSVGPLRARCLERLRQEVLAVMADVPAQG
jgi:RNA polymerase sigma factor (sigma-70 family)